VISVLLAEELALLLMGDASGRPVTDGQRVDIALAGGVLLELILRGHVTITERGHPAGKNRVVAVKAARTGEPVLDEALARITAGRTRRAQDTLPKLAKQLRPLLLDRLVKQGVLRVERSTLLGVFPRTRFRPNDGGPKSALRAAVHDVLVVGRAPTDREAGLISILQGVGQVPRVLGPVGIPKGELRRRAKKVAEGEAVGEAVRRAIQATDSAMTAAFAGAAAAGGSD
jgi:hypothetical protein